MQYVECLVTSSYVWSEQWNFHGWILCTSFFLRTNNCAVISLELLTVMNINLNGNTAGSCPVVSNISSSKSSENLPYVLTIVSSSRDAQWYLNNDISILSQL